jgi:hypothetical protein
MRGRDDSKPGDDDPMIGQTVSHHRIVEKLGAGGMGQRNTGEVGDCLIRPLLALERLTGDIEAKHFPIYQFRRIQ